MEDNNVLSPEEGICRCHDSENISKNFWRAALCRRVQQRYVFITLSMVGSMFHTLMSLGMNIALVAMVSKDMPSLPPNFNASNAFDAETSTTPNDDTSTLQNGEFNWDEMIQGYIITAASFGSVVSGLAGARIAELWSPKMMYGIAILSSAFCNIIIPTAAKLSVAALIAVRVLQGVFNGPVLAIHSILLSVWIPPQERTKLGGLFYAAESIGMVMSMFLSGILISAVSWEFIFYLYGSFIFVWSVFWFLFVYDSPKSHPTISEKERDYILENVTKDSDAVYPVPWLDILTSSPVWAHIAMACGYTWVLYVVLTQLPTYLKNMLHYDVENSGITSALPLVATLLGCVLFSFISQFLRTRKYLSHLATYRFFNAISTLGPAAALIAVTQLGSDATSIVILIVVASGLNAALIGGSVYNLIDLGINFAGTTQGICWIASQTVSIVSPNIASAIINNNQTESAWNRVFYISAGAAVFPYLVFLMFGSVEEQPWNKPEKRSPANDDVEKC